MFLIPFTTLAALSDTMKLTLGHISNSSQTSFGLSMILSAVWVSKFLFRFWSNNVNFNVAGFYDKTKETGKHKQKKERVKGKFKERRRERKGQGRVKDTKEKRKHWKSKSEVGKENLISLHQCLGSGSGSVWSARFWLPGSGTAKICRSTEPIPRGKISTKNCKKKLFTPKTKIWTCYLSWSWDMDWH